MRNKKTPMTLNMFSECWDINLINPNNENDVLVAFDCNDAICKVLQDGKDILCDKYRPS